MTTSNDLQKVRYSNEGGDFHVLWASRKTLRLLDFDNDLKAVAIEGISGWEGSDVTEGLLVIDVCEYYGGERFGDARKIIYSQLKHSTKHEDEDWSIGGLQDTINGFANRYKAMVKKFGSTKVLNKVVFQFISNRPVSKNIQKAIEAILEDNADKLRGHASNAFKILSEMFKDSEAHLKEFLSILVLDGKQANRSVQEIELTKDLKNFMAGEASNIDVQLRLKKLIHDRTLPSFKDLKEIRREDLLNAFHLSFESLFPSPTRFENDEKTFSRKQETEIVSEILSTRTPILIHASGGVGKSVLARRLGTLMPEGSTVRIFDGFAGGEYRLERVPRHQHKYGLVQLANEMAKEGLCNPLLPLEADPAAYLAAFKYRLEIAIAAVRAEYPLGLVVIILDAADNSLTAAEESHDSTFIKGLLQEAPPEGCKIIALARTERCEKFKFMDDVTEIKLKPFDKEESAQHIRQFYPSVDDDSVDKFHTLTGGNPRVQAYEIAEAKGDLDYLINNLGPTVRNVDDIIAAQVTNSIKKHIRDHASQADVDRLCYALAVLPPAVPISILALAAKVSESAVRSFVSDLGHPLLIKDDKAVQFRDEPVETWFREQFKPSSANSNELAVQLSSIAKEDSYVQVILPRLLYGAGRYDDLIELALNNSDTKNLSSILRREITLRRVQYAMKAMLTKNRPKDVMKLILKAAEELASKERQAEYLIDNSGLIATLCDLDTTRDLIYRKHTDRWTGIDLVHRAAILAVNPQSRSEASGFLRQAERWTYEWSRTTPSREKEEYKIENDDVAAFAIAAFHLEGADAAIDSLLHWKPKYLRFETSRLLARHIINFSNKDKLIDLIKAAGYSSRILLGIAFELKAVGSLLPKQATVRVAQTLLRWRDIKREYKDTRSTDGDYWKASMLLVAEALAVYRQKGLSEKILDKYFSVLPRYSSRTFISMEDECVLTARVQTLAHALRNEELKIESLIPKETTEEKNRKDTVDELTKIYSDLIPWFSIKANFTVGKLSAKEANDQFSAIADKFQSYRYHEHFSDQLRQIFFDLWLSVRISEKDISDNKVEEILKKLKLDFPSIPNLTRVIRLLAHHGSTTATLVKFASRAAKMVKDQHISAVEGSGYFASLATALLPNNPREAQAYLNAGFDLLDGLDHEVYYLLQLIFDLCERIGNSGKDAKKNAYRVARVIELIHAFNDHKFPWPSATMAVADLDPVSAVAIISRWRDRDKGWFGENCPALLKHLLEKGQISPEIPIALNVFGVHWRFAEVMEAAFEKSNSSDARILLGKRVIQDLKIQGCEDSLAKKLQELFKKYGVSTDEINALHEEAKEVGQRKAASEPIVYANDRKRRDKNKQKPITVSSIIAKYTFLKTSEIDSAISEFRGSDLGDWNTFFGQIRKVIPVSEQSVHIGALAASKNIPLSVLLDVLVGAKKEWKDSIAVSEQCKIAVETIIQIHASEFAKNDYLLNLFLSQLDELTDVGKEALLSRMLSFIVENLEAVPNHALQTFVAKYSDFLNADDCSEILTFLLDGFDKLLKDDDGDGPWVPSIEPNCTIQKSIAELLRACLSAPKIELRWNAAHVVHRLCELGQRDVIKELVLSLHEKECVNFTDKRFPFYHMHAQLYGLIACARAAIENPSFFLEHAKLIQQYTDTSFEHVLIRHFAAKTALLLEEYKNGTYSKEEVAKLKSVDLSPLPLKKWDKKNPYMDKSAWREKARFNIDYNFREGWLHSLARVFAISRSDLENNIESIVINDWKISDQKKWNDDPREKANLYRERETWGDKYSYPRTDSYHFYLTLHGMFCAAGSLLKTHPIRANDWESDPWIDWLSSHTVRQRSGFWLADYRDPIPADVRVRSSESRSGNWRWEMTRETFDSILWLDHKDHAEIVVHGDYDSISSFSPYERVDIGSAFVSPDTSLALLRSLQTRSDLSGYRIPTYDPSSHDNALESYEKQFRMIGWVEIPYREHGLDSHDPLSGDIRFPQCRPRPAIERTFKLSPSSDGRFWRHKETPVLRADTWGTWDKSDRVSKSDSGYRLVAKLDFILKMLQHLNRDMIIEVRINRDDPNGRTGIDYVQPYTKYYVLRSDGTAFVLEGSYRIR